MEEENTKYELFLHMVGGHAFILTTGEGKLIKSAKVKEIEFYEFCEGKDISKHIPKYYGKILINSKEFWEIEKFYRQLKIFFRQFVLECNFSAEFLNTENDENFNENYKLFLSEYNKEHKYSYEKYFQKLRSYLLSVCRNKLKWILFWFIKWHHSFMKNDFIIIEDLTADMSHPAILDLKLWSISKSSKKVPTVTTDIGCRIMGEEAYNHNKNFEWFFKNRYDFRNFESAELVEQIKNFFVVGLEFVPRLVEKVINELKQLIEDLNKTSGVEIPNSSLLIVYDTDQIFNDKTRHVKLIDFSYYKNVMNRLDGEIDQHKSLINSLNNIIVILESILQNNFNH